MKRTHPKYEFNAITKSLFLKGEYVHMPGPLLQFLYFLSYTIDHSPPLPKDGKVNGISLPELRKRLGRSIGSENAKELVECISNLGYRFNPGLITKGILVVKGKPTKESVGVGYNPIDLDEYHPYSTKTGGYQDKDKWDDDDEEKDNE